MNKALLFIWRRLSGSIQWYLLWFMHHKFVVGVSGVIFDKEGKILLIKHKYRNKNSVWGLPSGHAERKETLEQTLIREVSEETSYEISVNSLIRIRSGKHLRIEAIYIGDFIGGDLKIDPVEILDVGFFMPDQLPDKMIDSQKQDIKEAIKLRRHR